MYIIISNLHSLLIISIAQQTYNNSHVPPTIVSLLFNKTPSKKVDYTHYYYHLE